MIKKPLYRYLGKNGLITSVVELISLDYIPMYRLSAAPGFILTDGERKGYNIDIFQEDLNKWEEIEDFSKEEN